MPYSASLMPVHVDLPFEFTQLGIRGGSRSVVAMRHDCISGACSRLIIFGIWLRIPELPKRGKEVCVQGEKCTARPTGLKQDRGCLRR